MMKIVVGIAACVVALPLAGCTSENEEACGVLDAYRTVTNKQLSDLEDKTEQINTKRLREQYENGSITYEEMIAQGSPFSDEIQTRVDLVEEYTAEMTERNCKQYGNQYKHPDPE